jgi:hypothetical protein
VLVPKLTLVFLQPHPSSARKWESLCTHDSRALESAYQRLQDDIPWNSDEDEAEAGAAASGEATPRTKRAHIAVPRVPIRGGLFDVDIVTRDAYPVYWDSAALKVLRATWFLNGKVRSCGVWLSLGLLWLSHGAALRHAYANIFNPYIHRTAHLSLWRRKSLPPLRWYTSALCGKNT